MERGRCVINVFALFSVNKAVAFFKPPAKLELELAILSRSPAFHAVLHLGSI